MTVAHRHPLAPAQGCLLGLVIGVLVWATVAAVVVVGAKAMGWW